MKLTKHATQRMKQRHISNNMVQLASSLGVEVKNTDKIRLTKDEVGQLYEATLYLIKKFQKCH
jgi:hypothetical protein